MELKWISFAETLVLSLTFNRTAYGIEISLQVLCLPVSADF